MAATPLPTALERDAKHRRPSRSVDCGEVKRQLVEGEDVGGFDPDVRALSSEHFDEDGLLRFARERIAETIRPVLREVLERAATTSTGRNAPYSIE